MANREGMRGWLDLRRWGMIKRRSRGQTLLVLNSIEKKKKKKSTNERFIKILSRKKIKKDKKKKKQILLTPLLRYLATVVDKG